MVFCMVKTLRVSRDLHKQLQLIKIYWGGTFDYVLGKLIIIAKEKDDKLRGFLRSQGAD